MEIYNDVYGIKEQSVGQLAHLVGPLVPGIIFPEGGLDHLAQIINVLLKIELQGHTSDWRGDYWLTRTTTDAVYELGQNLEDDYDEQYWQEPDFKEYSLYYT